MKIRLILVSSIALLFLLSCGGGDRQTYTVEVIDGVRHVHNLAPLWGDGPKVKLEFVQKIGEFESDDENYLLYRPTDVACDGDGNIYILDRGNHRIQKFTSDGTCLMTIGREGQGPGEMAMPTTVRIAPGGRLMVTDQGNKRFQFYSFSGGDLGSVRMDGFSATSDILSTGEIVCNTGSYTQEKEFSLLTVFQPDGSNGRSIVPGTPEEDFGKFGYYNNIQFCAGPSDNIVLGYVHREFVELYDSAGPLRWRADRPLNYDTPETPDFREMNIGGEVVKISYRNRVSGDVDFDHKGRFWVTTFRRQVNDKEFSAGLDSTTDIIDYHLFSPEGVLLYVMSPDWPMGLISICGDRFFYCDPEVEMAVYEYKIVDLED